MLSGSIIAIEVACAFFGSSFNFSSIGTIISPPPAPKKPLKIPAIKPTT